MKAFAHMCTYTYTGTQMEPTNESQENAAKNVVIIVQVSDPGPMSHNPSLPLKPKQYSSEVTEFLL